MLKSIFLYVLFCSIATATTAQVEIRRSNYPSGQMQFAYTYNKGVLNGPYYAYYESGRKWAEGNYINGQLEGAFITYTQDGDTACLEEYKAGKQWIRTVFYQEYPDNIYKLISKQGFVCVKNGESTTLDENTPDGYIEKTYELMVDGLSETTYIWKNGKREPFTLPKPADQTR